MRPNQFEPVSSNRVISRGADVKESLDLIVWKENLEKDITSLLSGLLERRGIVKAMADKVRKAGDGCENDTKDNSKALTASIKNVIKDFHRIYNPTNKHAECLLKRAKASNIDEIQNTVSQLRADLAGQIKRIEEHTRAF